MSDMTNTTENTSAETAADSTDTTATAPAATATDFVLWNDDESTGGKEAVAIIKGKNGLDGHRRIFGSLADAIAAIGKIAESLTASESESVKRLANTLPIALAGHGDMRTLDSIESVPFANQPVIVTALGAKGNKRSGIRGLVIMPNPTVSDFLATPEGTAFAAKVIEKEVAHVGLRQLRNEAANGTAAIFAAAEAMPATVDDFAKESTRVGVDTTGFDAVWSGLRKKLGAAIPGLLESLPRNKAEVITAIRSASWAAEMYPDLEKRNVFTGIGQLAIKAIDALPADTDADSDEVAGWLRGRDEYNAPVKERAELTRDVDLSQIKL